MDAPVHSAARLLCVGLIGRETIRMERSEFDGWGGAALYFAAAAAAAGRAPRILTALTAHDEAALTRDLATVSSALTVTNVPTSHPCTFDLAYGHDLHLTEFSYTAGGMGNEPMTIEAIQTELLSGLDERSPVHLHVCPLPSSLMKAIAPAILARPTPFSIQAHFSEIDGSRSLLVDMMSRASYVFMNRAEAGEIFDARTDHELRHSIEQRILGICFVTDPTGVTVFRDRRWLRFAAAPMKAIEPTGAGDALAGGVVGRLLTGADIVTSVNTGLAMASVTIGAPSSSGILPLSQTGMTIPPR